MHTSIDELNRYFSVWTPKITIAQRHEDLVPVDKDTAPATPIPIDQVNQAIYMQWLYLINKSELCARCGQDNMQAVSGALGFFPGLPGMVPFIFRDVCVGNDETIDHFIEKRMRVQVAMSIPQMLYHAGYGWPDIVWPRAIFDDPDNQGGLIVV